MPEVKELKNNVKWLKNGLVVGYGYSEGEEGYINPKAEITIREEKEGKLVENTENTLKYLIKKEFVEAF
jgi:hypothetical protein